MLADDLLGGVALDVLRAGVPAGDGAVGVEQVDRIVRHRGHQQAEHLLAAPQRDLGGDVLHLREDVERLAPGVTDRGQRDAQRARPVVGDQRVLEGHRVLGAVGDPGQRLVEVVTVLAGQHAVVQADEVVRLPVDHRGQLGVGAHDAAVQRHRGHADGGLVEDLAVALQVLVEGRLVLRRGLVEAVRDVQAERAQRPLGDGRRLHVLPQQLGQLLDRDGLLDEVARPELPGPARQPHALEPGEHHDLRARRDGQHQGQRLQAVEHGHRGVQQHQVGAVLVGQDHRLTAVAALADDVEEPGGLQARAHHDAELGGVVDDHHRRAS